MVWQENKFLKVFLILCLSITSIKFVGAQSQVDSTWWEEVTKDIDYTEENEKIEIQDFNAPVDMNDVMGVEWTYIFFGISLLVILFILYRLFGKKLLEDTEVVSKKDYSYYTEKDLDDHFYEMDLDELLQKAIGDKDWKMAIRLRYLQILKGLMDAEKIIWHRDLTNRQIQMQLSSNASLFGSIVTKVERAWYGDQLVHQKNYDEFIQLKEEFLKKGENE